MKEFLFALLHHAGVFRFFAWLNRRQITILSYHSVIDSSRPLDHDPHKQHIPLPLFQAHLDYLKRNYNVISVADFLEARHNNLPLPDYSLVLTFEDGFRDFHQIAAPQLEQRRLPATVFVITDFAAGQPGPAGESFLSWNEIRDLSDRGFEIGSHTCSHPNLTGLSLEEASNQLSLSFAVIRRHVSQPQIPISYPYGYTSEAIGRLAREAGYCCGIGDRVVGSSVPTSDLFALSRITIASDDGVPALAARVSRFASWARSILKNADVEMPPNETEGQPGYSPPELETCSSAQVISS